MTARVEPSFIGFFPKRVVAAPAPLAEAGVDEICSVSQCLAPGPSDWIASWTHNEHGFFDTEAAALASIHDDGDYRLYAYELYPYRIDALGSHRLEIRSGGNVTDRYDLIGFDIVSRSNSDFFECSPLSCNLAALVMPVNRYCLAADEATAMEYARRIADEGSYEPGPYHIVRVSRRRS